MEYTEHLRNIIRTKINPLLEFIPNDLQMMCKLNQIGKNKYPKHKNSVLNYDQIILCLHEFNGSINPLDLLQNSSFNIHN